MVLVVEHRLVVVVEVVAADSIEDVVVADSTVVVVGDILYWHYNVHLEMEEEQLDVGTTCKRGKQLVLNKK